MSRTTKVILIPTTLILLLVVGGGPAFAKGGRGGPRGGKRSFAGGGSKNFGGSKITRPNVRRDSGSFGFGKSDQTGSGTLQRGRQIQSAMPGDTSFRGMSGKKNVFGGGAQDYRSRELNKLNHRRQISDQLRSIGEKNGNENLSRVADQMDHRAQDHYDRQMAKFDPSYTPDNTTGDPITDQFDSNLPAENAGLDTPFESDGEVTRAAQKLTGTENALSRQVRNEERKLAKRLESVDRMRELAAQSGDDSLLQSADRMEEWAMNHFDQRMMKITDFQERHGLPDASNYLSQ